MEPHVPLPPPCASGETVTGATEGDQLCLSRSPPGYAGREERVLGDLFGLSNFGVNLTRLKPGAVSSLRHAHSKQDELIYVLEGHPVLVTNAGETRLEPGMCAGFRRRGPEMPIIWSTAAPGGRLLS